MSTVTQDELRAYWKTQPDEAIKARADWLLAMSEHYFDTGRELRGAHRRAQYAYLRSLAPEVFE